MGLAAYSMDKAQAGLSGNDTDIELICTGKTMRFISVSASDLAGEFVFISPDIDKVGSDPIDCTNGLLANTPQADAHIPTLAVAVQFTQFYALTQSLIQRPYTAYAYAAPLSRAPPLS